MKNSIDTIGNRTRDLPACSAVPQPTAPLLFNIRHKSAVLIDAATFDATKRPLNFPTQSLSSPTKLDQRCLTARHTIRETTTHRKPHTHSGHIVCRGRLPWNLRIPRNHVEMEAWVVQQRLHYTCSVDGWISTASLLLAKPCTPQFELLMRRACGLRCAKQCIYWFELLMQEKHEAHKAFILTEHLSLSLELALQYLS